MLQGTLNDFSLPDVFSLLALTKKSGALRVASDATDGRVFFRDGAVCLALSDGRRVPLGARLVSAGLVDEAQLRALVEDNTGSSLAVTEALIASGQVEDRILSVFLREQIVDAVFELMRLNEGNFSFDATEPALSRGVALSVVEVVGEATRRLEEWQTINRRIASPQAILAMVPAAMDGREGVNLVSEQWDLLTLIDGRRSVAEVVELTGKGEFATCRVLGDLVEAGLVEAQDPSTGGQTRLDALIAARETLRSLEHVEQAGGIRPKLSSAAPVGANGSAVRWIEPTKEAEVAQAKPQRTAPRGRDAELAVLPPPTPAAAPAGAAPAAEKPPPEPKSQSPEPVAAPKPAPAAPAPPPAEATPDPVPAARANVDRAQMARELASLGFDDEPIVAADRPAARLTRDEEVNKGLLLRLIDGVKGA